MHAAAISVFNFYLVGIVGNLSAAAKARKRGVCKVNQVVLSKQLSLDVLLVAGYESGLVL